MADIHQVWEGHDGWKTLELRYYVHQDFDQQPNIENAFDFIMSARVLGAQIGQVILNPLKNTNPLTMPIGGGAAGSIQGQLDDWQAYLPDGSKAVWTQGGLASARFKLTLDIAITVPVVGKIQVKAFHKPVTVLLHWDAQKKRYVYMPAT